MGKSQSRMWQCLAPVASRPDGLPPVKVGPSFTVHMLTLLRACVYSTELIWTIGEDLLGTYFYYAEAVHAILPRLLPARNPDGTSKYVPPVTSVGAQASHAACAVSTQVLITTWAVCLHQHIFCVHTEDIDRSSNFFLASNPLHAALQPLQPWWSTICRTCTGPPCVQIDRPGPWTLTQAQTPPTARPVISIRPSLLP